MFEHALTLTDDEKPKLTSSFCLLEAKDEDELRQIAGQLEQDGIKFTAFYEPDYNTGYTAITAGPIYGDNRKKFKKYKFFRGEK